jgi:ferredoxin-type protein NapH
MTQTRATRQRLRRAVILVSVLLFPVVLNYLSPYVIIDGASQGIVNGSFIMFGLLFLSALFLGRLWCAWGCPGAGLQEACFGVNDRPARGGRLDWIKWVIWGVWLAVIALAAASAGGYHAVNFFHLTESGISVDAPSRYITYYLVVGTFVGLAWALGRRAGCHTICWMAPFMILGRKLRNVFKWPALRLEADPAKCTNCLQCTKACPMSLPVNQMVNQGHLENSECILCGNCVDGCARKVIHYAFKPG